MTTADPDRILAEFAHLRDPGSDPALAAVQTALLVEDVFGVTLTDDQIDPAVLAEPGALRSLVTGTTEH